MRGAWSGRAGTRRAALGRRRGDGGLRSGRAGMGRSAGLPTLAPEATRRQGCAGATRSGMDSGSVAAERPKRTQGRQRLLSPGCGVPARPGISKLPSGRSWPRPRGRAARASPLLLLLLVPSPRLAATARRRTLVERSRPGLVIPAAALGAGWNALGRLRLGARRVAALVSSRRGETGRREGDHTGDPAVAKPPGRGFRAQSPGGLAPDVTHTRGCPCTRVGAREKWKKVLEAGVRHSGPRGERSGNEGMSFRIQTIDSFMACCRPFSARHFTSCLG